MLIGIPTPELLPEMVRALQRHRSGECAEAIRFAQRSLGITRAERDRATAERDEMRVKMDQLIDAVADGFLVRHIEAIEFSD